MVTNIVDSLESLSVEELKEVVTAAESILKNKIEGERKAFLEETQRRAAALGVDMRHIFGTDTQFVSPNRSARRGREDSRSGAARAKAAVKYRGPNGQEWSGRGRPPRWVAEVEAQGKKLADFAV